MGKKWKSYVPLVYAEKLLKWLSFPRTCAGLALHRWLSACFCGFISCCWSDKLCACATPVVLLSATIPAAADVGNHSRTSSSLLLKSCWATGKATGKATGTPDSDKSGWQPQCDRSRLKYLKISKVSEFLVIFRPSDGAVSRVTSNPWTNKNPPPRRNFSGRTCWWNSWPIDPSQRPWPFQIWWVHHGSSIRNANGRHPTAWPQLDTYGPTTLLPLSFQT